MERWMPLVKDGCFFNPWPGGQAERGFTDVLKWKWGCRSPVRPPWDEMVKMIPTMKCDTQLLRDPRSRGVALGSAICTWIGHATYLVQVDGLSVLTDPIWSERCSMVQFAGPMRLVPPPLSLDELLATSRVDVVSISHNHYDHLDVNTIEALAAKFNPYFVVPLGMKSQWFQKCSFIKDLSRVVELNWWESVMLRIPAAAASRGRAEDPSCCTTEPSIRMTAVPAHHWSFRSLGNRNKQLWCGFVMDFFTSGTAEYRGSAERDEQDKSSSTAVAESVPSQGSNCRRFFRRVYHAGDTGYCEALAQIGRELGPMDVSLIPIGAYEPRWFMKTQHINPDEAVRTHIDVKSRNSLAMHWGTFILTDEPVDEPPIALRTALKDHGIDANQFRCLAIGESAIF